MATTRQVVGSARQYGPSEIAPTGTSGLKLRRRPWDPKQFHDAMPENIQLLNASIDGMPISLWNHFGGLGRTDDFRSRLHCPEDYLRAMAAVALTHEVDGRLV